MLRRLVLRDFRCFQAVALEPGERANFFVGANAQGKTSILEAACVVLRLQSPRARTFGELTRHGCSAFYLGADLGENRLELEWEKRRKRCRINAAQAVDATDYLAQGRVVWFGNRDLDLVTGRGEHRRRYLDFIGQQLDPAYRLALRRYARALEGRNALLKAGAPDLRRQCAAFDTLLLNYGAIVRSSRIVLVERLSTEVAIAHTSIGAGRSEHLGLRYVVSGVTGQLDQDLESVWERDVRIGQTHVGPHRDDLEILLDTHPAARFASEGQQRTVALALKCGQQRLLTTGTGPQPVVLMDDIFGELDLDRRRALLRFLPADAQLWLTATHWDWAEGFPEGSRFWEVRGGAVGPHLVGEAWER